MRRRLLRSPGRAPLAVAAAALLALPAAIALARTPPGVPEATLPLVMSLGYETLRLPGHEPMGWVAGQLLFGLGDGWWLGPSTYGAATGRRGGLFVGGVELQRRWAVGPGLTLSTGLSLGGGGGAAAPVGDGLMLRPAAALLQDWGPLQVGLSWSMVRFPGSDIRSRQAGLALSWRGGFGHRPLGHVGETIAAEHRSGLGFDRFALTLSQHRPRATAGDARRFSLVGARLEQRRDGHGGSWGLDAAAAAQGQAAGYMEILAYAGQAWQLSEALAVGVRAAAGLGGGGGVPTGGGRLARIDGELTWRLLPGWQAGLSLGRTAGSTAALRAQRTGFWLAADLEPDALPGAPGRSGTLRRAEWGGALMHIGAVPRADGSRRPVDALGLVLRRGLGDHGYLSGQVYSALAGQAGGYSIGLVGAGWSTSASAPGWQFGAELLAGGAGGGGASGISGALLQTQLWAGRTLADPAQRLRLGIGAMASSSGKTARPLATLTWSRAFGQVGP